MRRFLHLVDNNGTVKQFNRIGISDVGFHMTLVNMYRNTLKAFKQIETILIDAKTPEEHMAARAQVEIFRKLMWNTDGELNEI